MELCFGFFHTWMLYGCFLCYFLPDKCFIYWEAAVFLSNRNSFLVSTFNNIGNIYRGNFLLVDQDIRKPLHQDGRLSNCVNICWVCKIFCVMFSIFEKENEERKKKKQRRTRYQILAGKLCFQTKIILICLFCLYLNL